MKKTIIITAVISLLVGVILALAAYFTYIFFSMHKQINENTANITKIVDFINQNIEANTPTASTKKPATVTKAESTSTKASKEE